MEHEHSRSAIAERLARAPTVSYLRDWVYGGIDGAVTTFAVVAGVVGAELSNRVVLILGAANLVADGFSMAASNYSGTKTEHEELAQLRAVEERHIDAVPDGEREEVRQIFRAKGFEGRSSGAGGGRDHRRSRALGGHHAGRGVWPAQGRCARRSRPPPAPSPRSCLCGAIPLLPFLFQTAAPVRAVGGRDRAGVLPDRLDQEPLVAGRAGGARARETLADRARRGRARLPRRRAAAQRRLSAAALATPARDRGSAMNDSKADAAPPRRERPRRARAPMLGIGMTLLAIVPVHRAWTRSARA